MRNLLFQLCFLFLQNYWSFIKHDNTISFSYKNQPTSRCLDIGWKISCLTRTVRRICHPNLSLAEFKEQDKPLEGLIFKLKNNCKVNMQFSLLIETDWITTNQEKHKLEKYFDWLELKTKSFLSESEKTSFKLAVSNSRPYCETFGCVNRLRSRDTWSVRSLSRSQQLRRRDWYEGFLGLWGETLHLKAVSIQHDGTLLLRGTFVNFQRG